MKGPTIKPQGNGTYLVESSTVKDKFYFVNIRKLYCDCPATKMQCRHINAVLNALLNDTLSEQQRGNMFGTTKEEAELCKRI